MEEAQESDGSCMPLHTITNWEIPSSESDPYPNDHVKATLLFELASVSITRDTFMELDAELGLPRVEIPHVTFYGHIRLTDDLGNEFYLFHRERNDPKTVSLHNPISVILPKFELKSPRCLPKTFFLEFYLRDRQRKMVILDEWKFFDCTHDDVIYDKEHYISYGPDDVSPHMVYVNYTIFQCALLAHVGVAVVKIDEDDSDGSAEVSGIISAACKARQKSCIDRVLFDNARKLDFGALIKLSTLAVPAYSSLDIHANLKVNGEQIVSDGALEFEACDWVRIPLEKEIMGQKCRIRVFVTWRHAIDCLPEYDSHEWRAAEGASSEEIEDCFSETEETSDKRKSSIEASRITGSRKRKQKKFLSVNIKSRQLLDLTKQNGKMWTDHIRWKKIVKLTSKELVEVFSIFICSDGVGGHVASPRGTILCRDNRGVYLIFDGDKQRPDILHSDELVPLVEPRRCYVGPHFGIELDLKDVDGREICFGRLGYDFHTVTPWLDRRICSVVRGKHGFAAVHYTIFNDAVQAKLKFTVQSNIGTSAVCCQVKGRINARYGNCRYSTHYEKKHYQSILFRKSEFVDLDGDEIPLSKSVVAVPIYDSSLIVIADIRVLIEGGYVETLKCKAAINPEIRSHTTQGSNYRLIVSVELS